MEEQDGYDRHMAATQQILDDKFKNGTIENLYIPEKLEGLQEIRDFNERVLALRNNSDRSLNTILFETFRPDRAILTSEAVESLEYKPAYEGDDVSIAAVNLYDTARRLYVFHREDITISHMKKIATDILEGLHYTEVEVFKGIFAGLLPYSNITKELVMTAFPDLFPDENVDISSVEEVGGETLGEIIQSEINEQVEQVEAISDEDAARLKKEAIVAKRKATIARKKAEAEAEAEDLARQGA